VLESVKAASNILMPLDGEVVAINDALPDTPELVNQDPLGEAWFFRFRPADAGAWEKLLDQAAYDRLLNANADA
ncbi:glycine cleavage system protein H, partial [Pseudomonas aeruginosa]|nr:glycine cleavage system protein H [Pseudomonas aeruginosa]